jgi:hypothetical protein
LENSSQKFCFTSLILEKLPSVNNRPWGENSPNLVTLPPEHLRTFILFSGTLAKECPTVSFEKEKKW